MTFQLGGMPRTLSIFELARALDVWDGDEVVNLNFDAYLSNARTSFFSAEEVGYHWALIGNFEYGP